MAAKKIIILASGGGSNAEKIMEHFQSSSISVHAVLCNRKEAGVYKRAANYNIPCVWLDASNDVHLLDYLQMHQPDLLVLAGYLKKIPPAVIDLLPKRIVNIHPALLPKFGGKGMYGMHVHQAVKAAGEKTTGMTIHLVNEHYDEGAILFQDKVTLSPSDTAEDIAKKVLQLEHEHYPRVIAKYLASNG